MNVTCECKNTYLNKRVLSIIDKVNKDFDVKTHILIRGPRLRRGLYDTYSSDAKNAYSRYKNVLDLTFIGVYTNISIETGGRNFCSSEHRSQDNDEGTPMNKSHDTEESLEQLLIQLFSEAQRLQVKC